MRISSKRNKQNTKKYKKIRNRKKKVSRKVGGMFKTNQSAAADSNQHVEQIKTSNILTEYCDEEQQEFATSTKSLFDRLDEDDEVEFVKLYGSESEPFQIYEHMKRVVTRGTGIFLTFKIVDEAISEKLFSKENVFLTDIYDNPKIKFTLNEQMNISKEIIRSFSADATREYNKYLIYKRSQELLAGHLNTIIQKERATQTAEIAYDVAQANICLEITNLAAAGEGWEKIKNQLQDDKIELLKGYILSKYDEQNRPSLQGWTLEKIYAYVLCGIGVRYLLTDPFRGYFIISLSNVGHHILGQNNEPVPTASLPSFITLCMDLIKAEVENSRTKFTLHMYQLLDKLLKYIERNNEIQGFLNMTAFAGKYTLNILQFMCNSGSRKKKRGSSEKHENQVGKFQKKEKQKNGLRRAESVDQRLPY